MKAIAASAAKTDKVAPAQQKENASAGQRQQNGENGPAAALLRLQRTHGNRFVNRLIQAPIQRTLASPAPLGLPVQREGPEPHVGGGGNGGGASIQLAGKPPVFTPQEQVRYRTQISDGRTATKGLSEKFTAMMDTAGKFIAGFRGKSNWVNGSYAMAYGHHEALVKVVGAADAQRQVIANLIVALGLNVLTEGMADILEGAKLITETVGFWGSAISNTALGAVANQDVPIAKVDPSQNPAFTQLAGLQTLDKLNAAILPLAVKGSRNLLGVFAGAGDLTDALVANDDDPKKIAKPDFESRLAALQKMFERIPLWQSQIDKQMASYGSLWTTFYASPWPDHLRSEQDIWIVWLSKQVTMTESWSAAAWGSSLENSKLTAHLADIGVSGTQAPAGRLGVKSYPDWKLKQAAAAEVPAIAKYWASAFLQ